MTVASAGATSRVVTVTQTSTPPPNITTISLSHNSWILTTDETFTPTITTIPVNQQNQLSWSSSNSRVASVDSLTGQITGLSDGESIITATAPSGVRATISITVCNDWHSDADNAFFWDLRTLRIFSQGVDFCNDRVQSYMNEAQRIWSEAVGGMDFVLGTAENSHILSFTGSYEEMENLAGWHDIRVQVPWGGVASFAPIIQVGNINVSGYRRIFRFQENFEQETRAVMLNKVTNSYDQSFSNAFIRYVHIHELGHLMGYNGHSVVPGQLMYGNNQYNLPQTLSAEEKRHLRRIYDRFRN